MTARAMRDVRLPATSVLGSLSTIYKTSLGVQNSVVNCSPVRCPRHNNGSNSPLGSCPSSGISHSLPFALPCVRRVCTTRTVRGDIETPHNMGFPQNQRRQNATPTPLVFGFWPRPVVIFHFAEVICAVSSSCFSVAHSNARAVGGHSVHPTTVSAKSR